MKIRKMTAHFGALDGRSLELSDGLNILYAPNESGKSTWCAFLRTMLFGLNTAQRGRTGQRPDKLKYRPWSGKSMSGSLELMTAEGPVTIRRWTERENQPMQAFSATVTGTDQPAYGLDADTAGQTLTGVSAPVFERSAFIRQSGLEVKSDPELDRRISAIVSSGDEAVSYLEAEGRLRAWQRLRRSGKRGAIPALEAALDETRRTLESIRAQARVASEAEEEIETLEKRQAETEARMRQVRAALRKGALARMGEARREVRQGETARDGAEALLRQAESALADTPFGALGPEAAAGLAAEERARADALYEAARRMPSVKRTLWLAIPAVLALALAFFLPGRPVLLGAGALLALLSAAAYAHLRRGRLSALRMLEERTALLEK